MDPEQQEGFAIVLKAHVYFRQFANSWRKSDIRYSKYLNELWTYFSDLNIAEHRGIVRSPLRPFPSLNQEVIEYYEGSSVDDITTRAARIKYRELIRDAVPDFEDDWLHNIEHVRQVFNLLEQQDDYEVVYLRTGKFKRNAATPGFDVGEWVSDYSILSDAILTPNWHPAPPEMFPEIAEYVKNLNRSILLRDEIDAQRYLDFYKTQEWAEQGGFVIIQIDAVSSDVYQ